MRKIRVETGAPGFIYVAIFVCYIYFVYAEIFEVNNKLVELFHYVNCAKSHYSVIMQSNAHMSLFSRTFHFG